MPTTSSDRIEDLPGAKSAARASPATSRLRILLVEDDEMNRDMLSRRLQLEGYAVLEAVDGLQGVARARSDQPDLILMDISLPGLDGWEATRRLKADEATFFIPVVALTAHAMAGDAQRFFDAGCDGYESKPIDWQRLMATMKSLLAGGEP